ncbi:MAG: hypothetical protein GY803_16570 [Chloroflexi bacterium]|nr:hypothetical protein [Chloroflexota bacterium]
MTETKTILQTIDDNHLRPFAIQLAEWLIDDLNQSDEPVPEFTESRAKALLRATNAVDAPTLDDFMRHIEKDTAVRLALHDLLTESGLENSEQLPVISNQSPISQSPNPWLSLAIAAYAWKSEYPLHQLDPASPPEAYSPAGQVIKRAAYWMRQQIQRSATERDKMSRKLAYQEDASPTLGNLQSDQPIAPVPPHFRPPIPVSYPEVVRIAPDESLEKEAEIETVTRNPRITITESDLTPERPSPRRMPPIRVEPQPTPRPRSAPSPANFNQAVRRKFGRNRERMVTTKLRVLVQEYPDGPGLYGLQVKVTCKGIRSHVAGTTGRDGRFLCELPVRERSGLTYDVDIKWPADLGGKTERKSVTLNADRTEFTLPFFQKQRADG